MVFPQLHFIEIQPFMSEIERDTFFSTYETNKVCIYNPFLFAIRTIPVGNEFLLN